jgi:DNA-binding NarL/FixJ family response regulator
MPTVAPCDVRNTRLIAPADLRAARFGRENERLIVMSYPFPRPDRLQLLSHAEVAVVLVASAGYSNARIAVIRAASERTIANQLASAYRKLGGASRSRLSLQRVNGLIPTHPAAASWQHVIETIYRPEFCTERWLCAVTRALHPFFEAGLLNEAGPLGRMSDHLAAGLRMRRFEAERGFVSEYGLDLNRSRTGHNAAGFARDRLRWTAIAAHDDRAEGDRPCQLAERAWEALLQGALRAIDHFDTSNRRFLLLQPRSPEARDVLPALRREVLARRAAGLSLKEIAFELGLATSTVGGALSKCLRSLGLRSVTELLYGMPSGEAGESVARPLPA